MAYQVILKKRVLKALQNINDPVLAQASACARIK